MVEERAVCGRRKAGCGGGAKEVQGLRERRVTGCGGSEPVKRRSESLGTPIPTVGGTV